MAEGLEACRTMSGEPGGVRSVAGGGDLVHRGEPGGVSGSGSAGQLQGSRAGRDSAFRQVVSWMSRGYVLLPVLVTAILLYRLLQSGQNVRGVDLTVLNGPRMRLLLGSLLGFGAAFPLALGCALYLNMNRLNLTGRWGESLLRYSIHVPPLLVGIVAVHVPGMNFVLVMSVILVPRLALMMLRELETVPGELAQLAYSMGARKQTVLFRQIVTVVLPRILAGATSTQGSVLGLVAPFLIILNSSTDGTGMNTQTLSTALYVWGRQSGTSELLVSAVGSIELLLYVILLSVAGTLWRTRLERLREGLR